MSEDQLKRSNAALQIRLKAYAQQNLKLRQTIEGLKERVQSEGAIKADKKSVQRERALRERTAKMQGRIASYMQGSRIILPQDDFKLYVEKCMEGNPKDAEEFLAGLKAEGYLPLFEELFSQEMAMAHGFNFKRLEPAIAFMRGKSDIDLAEKRGQSLDAQKKNLIARQKGRFDEFIKDEYIDPKKVKRICEVGAAWGAATRYLINRYNPKDYHVYEIDAGWAAWLEENLGVASKPCDGESFASTKDNSVDICMAAACMYFIPYMKQWNYLTEMARVLRPGGIAVFNVLLIENLGVRNMKAHLSKFFPRRSFGHLAKHCLDTAFPEDQFEQLIEEPKKMDHYRVYRKLKS